MPDTKHWSFGEQSENQRMRGSQQIQESEAERARLAEVAAAKQHARNDRLIIGGRAHTKKKGLS